MSNKPARVIGTTPEAVERAEQVLGRTLPLSFRSWLLRNNGRWGINTVRIFPVLDERDKRSTWDSIARNFQKSWQECLSMHPSASDLLPFGEFGTGDYYCLDYSRRGPTGELPVVLWSHKTGEREHRAESFAEFVDLAESGELDD